MNIMNLNFARAVLAMQDKTMRGIHDRRIFEGGYEYRLTYCPGFAPTVKVDRREQGKRNFKWFTTVGVVECLTASDAMYKVVESIKKKLGGSE